MRHLGFAAAALGLAGCQTHNNTLVFGTSTSIGLTVSAAATEGGSPQLTLGYKRGEGVWMPLRQVPAINGNGTFDAATGLYQSENLRNGETRKDAYSVFASIGARFNGGAQATQVEAGAGLAQFFATGAAAVNVSENEALVTVLKVDSAESTRAQAHAVAAAAGDLDSAIGKLSAENRNIVEIAAINMLDAERLILAKATTCAAASDAAWTTAIGKAKAAANTPIGPGVEARLNGLKTLAGRQDYLGANIDIAEALAATCP